MTTPLLLVVILNWNGKAATLECLESLTPTESCDFDVLVVDNGSTDGSLEQVQRAFPGVKVLCTGANLGYAGGMNVGLSAALKLRYKYTWILNNDTIIDAKAPRNLLAYMEGAGGRDVAACTPLIYRWGAENTIENAGSFVDSVKWTVTECRDPTERQRMQSVENKLEFLVGCALFLRNEVLSAIEMFDERFFMYYEDCDLSLRLVRAGWRLDLVREARVYHKRHGSSGGVVNHLVMYYSIRNRFLLVRKYCGGFRATMRSAYQTIKRICNGLELRPWVAVDDDNHVCLKAVFDGVCGRFGKRTIRWSWAGSAATRLGLWVILRFYPAVSPRNLAAQLGRGVRFAVRQLGRSQRSDEEPTTCRPTEVKS